METQKLVINNLSNQEDALKVENILRDVWGIRKVNVDVDKQEAVFSYDEKAASYIDFQQAVVDAGYRVEGDEGS
ncbi:heavy-metal-associated domain-containing protein [Thalassorhabdus alkalitolerans]|uniref:Heavy-metal-associated domain-containing protein n=1 Tax=Thalassorhabdus alkalitolerans TaxID=2282697 RepID=A0ABW0YSL9_9BACI|nr:MULTISPECIES: heavy-metal-associated domain-containing protein [Bacillaceae]